jgi:hypothetical protein
MNCDIKENQTVGSPAKLLPLVEACMPCALGYCGQYVENVHLSFGSTTWVSVMPRGEIMIQI